MVLRCYTPDEYAVLLKVSVKTVYRQIRRGALRVERIGRQYRIVRVVASGGAPQGAH